MVDEMAGECTKKTSVIPKSYVAEEDYTIQRSELFLCEKQEMQSRPGSHHLSMKSICM